MRVLVVASAFLAVTITACESDGSPVDPIELPDAAVGTYDMQSTPTGQSRSATCPGGDVFVNGGMYIQADHYFTKADIFLTPSGSPYCGYNGGTWVRVNATTLTLTPSLAGASPVQATIVGDDLTLQFSTPVAYRRRQHSH